MKPFTRLPTLAHFTWQVSFPKAFRLASVLKPNMTNQEKSRKELFVYEKKRMINFAKNTYKKILLWIPKFLLNKLSVLHYIIQVFFLSIIAVSLWLYDTPSLGTKCSTHLKTSKLPTLCTALLLGTLCLDDRGSILKKPSGRSL